MLEKKGDHVYAKEIAEEYEILKKTLMHMRGMGNVHACIKRCREYWF